MQHLLAPRSPTAAPRLQRSSSDFGHVTTPEVQLANLLNLTNCPRLRTAEAILQSILWALTPHRKYKDITLTLAQRAVDVATQITRLIEATKEAPQWPRHIAHLTEVLHEIRLFVQTETQRNVLHRDLLGETISIQYAEIEQRLTSVLDDVEQCNIEIRTGNSMCEEVPAMGDPQSQAPSSSSMNKADVVTKGEIFSNAHNIVITGGQYNSGQIFIQHPSSQESDEGIVPGIRVVAFEDISTNREIHRTPMYRLHSDNGSKRARVVKVFQGPRAKERAQKTARFHKNVMHPTFLHIVGVSPLNCEIPFLVFNGGFEGSLEVSIAKALEKDLRKSVILGLQTVIGLSSGLDYLRDVAYPFVHAGSQHFRAFLSLEGEVIISFDPDIAYEQSNLSVNEQSSLLKAGKPLLIFHELCQQTFDAACQAHYEQQRVERTYDDTLDFAFFGHSYEDLQGIASTSVISSTNVSFTKPLGRLPIDGHRRELVWKSQDENTSSLRDICFEFKAFLDSLPPLSEPTLHRRRGRYTVRTAHRCPGYNRTEITLTTSITRSAIVSHSTPLPHEICPVCNRVVQDVEIFDCICGGKDDESVPTIQCSKCCKWHHQRCVARFESTARSFTCPDCRRTQSVGKSSKPIIERPDMKWPSAYNNSGSIDPVSEAGMDNEPSSFSSDAIHTPQGRVPMAASLSAPPLSAVGGNKTHADFIGGFGLETPLESEERTSSEDIYLGSDESIGESSKPSDEERARQQRLERRSMRGQRRQLNQARRLPNFSSAVTPVASASTPTAVASLPPGLKSSKGKLSGNRKAAIGPTKRRVFKVVPPVPSAPAELVQSSPTSNRNIKRRYDNDTSAVTNGAGAASESSSVVTNEPSPPKRPKTDWESAPSKALRKKNEATDSIKIESEEDASIFLEQMTAELVKMAANGEYLSSEISDTLEMILKGYGPIPEISGAMSLGESSTERERCEGPTGAGVTEVPSRPGSRAQYHRDGPDGRLQNRADRGAAGVARGSNFGMSEQSRTSLNSRKRNQNDIGRRAFGKRRTIFHRKAAGR